MWICYNSQLEAVSKAHYFKTIREHYGVKLTKKDSKQHIFELNGREMYIEKMSPVLERLLDFSMILDLDKPVYEKGTSKYFVNALQDVLKQQNVYTSQALECLLKSIDNTAIVLDRGNCIYWIMLEKGFVIAFWSRDKIGDSLKVTMFSSPTEVIKRDIEVSLRVHGMSITELLRLSSLVNSLGIEAKKQMLGIE